MIEFDYNKFESTSALFKKIGGVNATVLFEKCIMTVISQNKKQRVIEFPERFTVQCKDVKTKNLLKDIISTQYYRTINNTSTTYFYCDYVDIKNSTIEKFINSIGSNLIKVTANIRKINKRTCYFSSARSKYQEFTYYDIEYIFYQSKDMKQIYSHQYTIKNDEKSVNHIFDMYKMKTIVSDLEKYVATSDNENTAINDESILMSPNVSALVAHEIGHFSEEDYFNNNKIIRDNFQKKLATEEFNLVNIARNSYYASSYYFDDNGQDPKNTYLYRCGRFIGVLDERHNSRLSIDDEESMPRMAHIMIEPKKHSFNEMLSRIKSGHYLKYPIVGMEYPGEFSFDINCLLAQRILNGELLNEYVSNVHIKYYTPDFLSRIIAVGNDMSVENNGYCYKGPLGKSVLKVTKSAPHILIM